VRNVIVTGGSRGIGLAIATQLAAAGYRVIAISRHPSEALNAAAAQAANAGVGRIEFRARDLSDTAGLSAFVRGLRQEFGPFYGLINNAGLGTGGVLANMPDSEIARLVQLNTLAPILLTKYVSKSMMMERAGRIINVASIVASAGYRGLSVYSASKAALLGFTGSLARELGPLGVTVNAIAPGFIATDMTEELTDEQREKIARRSALRRMAETVDVARSVEFLLGEGGRNITGTTLTIDAGNTA